MDSPSSPDVLLLDLVLVGIDEGVIQDEADLRRLYRWLRHSSARGADQEVTQDEMRAAIEKLHGVVK